MKRSLATFFVLTTSILLTTGCSTVTDDGTQATGANVAKTNAEPLVPLQPKLDVPQSVASLAAEAEAKPGTTSGTAPPDVKAQPEDPGDLILEQVKRAQRQQREAIAKAKEATPPAPEGGEAVSSDSPEAAE